MQFTCEASSHRLLLNPIIPIALATSIFAAAFLNPGPYPLDVSLPSTDNCLLRLDLLGSCGVRGTFGEIFGDRGGIFGSPAGGSSSGSSGSPVILCPVVACNPRLGGARVLPRLMPAMASAFFLRLPLYIKNKNTIISIC